MRDSVDDAVNSIDGRYEPYLVDIRARRWYSQDAAAATAAYRVLAGVLPAQQPSLATLYAASLAGIPPGEELRQLLAGRPGDRRRARVVRNPLPHRRRGRRRDGP